MKLAVQCTAITFFANIDEFSILWYSYLNAYLGFFMNTFLKIKLNYKKSYSYGAYYSGFDLFDSIYFENQTDLAFSALKIQVTSSPNILLSSEETINLPASGYRFLSCDFIRPDISYLASVRTVSDICITVRVFNEDGSLLASSDFSCKILPFNYFSGTNEMPECAAFFVTPNQQELSMVEVSHSSMDPLDFAHQLYDNIKELRITYFPEDYSGKVSLPVRLCERVLKEKFANSFELSLLFASAIERGGLSPIILFLEKGKVYCGFSLKKDAQPLIQTFEKNNRNFDDLYFVDGNDLAFGSNLPFDTALFQAKNSILLSDDRISILNISSAREHHLLPLPCRVFEKGNYILDEKDDDEKKHDFSDYDLLWKLYSEDDRVKTVLLGGNLSVQTKKNPSAFQNNLDMNQNKILSKILSNDFTLIRAHTGVGISTLFSKACALKMKNHRNVLYITDENYHPDSFAEISSNSFDQSFVWNLLKEENKTYRKDEVQVDFSQNEDLFTDLERMKNSLDRLNQYYSDLEGDKRIVSSFLMAAERYDQHQDANDSIIFSPEKVGMLTDEMVQEWFSTVNDLVKSLSEIGRIHENVLLLVRNKNFSYEYKSKLIRKLENFLHCVESILSIRDQVLPMFSSLDKLSSVSNIGAFCDLYRLLSEFSTLPEEFFAHPEDAEINFKKATRLIQAKEENDRILQTVKVSFQESVLELDASDLYTRFSALSGDKSFKAISQKHSILKSVKRYLKPNCDVENIEYILSRLSIYQKNCDLINKEKSSVFSLFSVFENNEELLWKNLPVVADLCYQAYSVFQSCFELQKLFSFVSEFQRAKNLSGVPEKVQFLRELLDEYSVLKNELDALVQNDIDFFYPISSQEDFFSYIYKKLTEVLSASDQLKNWCNWLSIKEKAVSIGLKNIIVAVENGKIENDELKRGFLRAFFKAVCEYNYISHPDLIPENFSISDTENEYFKSFDQSQIKQKNELDAILTLDRFEALREIENSSFSPSELIKNRKVFSALFPCVISNRQKAKELFSDKRHFFDLILVESRNALPLEDILWMFYAGKQVAFAGSLSYSRRKSNVDFDLANSAFDYLWKVTDEKYSLSASYYSKPYLTSLKNSYFSSIRSDMRYYSIPSVSYLDCAEVRVVPGSFGGEYPGANFYEAQITVDELISFAMTQTEKSVGVIAATVEQKKLILRLLAQKLRHQEDLAKCFIDYNRFYITSLNETLYPCDKVIFSATFATDRSVPGSRIHYSYLDFGGKDPVKAVGNMLSCAKEEILILTSFVQSDLLHSPTLLPANTAFMYLLDALDTPRVNNSYRVIGQLEETAQIKRLRTELDARGYRVLSGVQNGRYFIDLAILNEKDEFVLGLISDQSVLRQQNNISAIELANSWYFSSNGWQLYRIRSTECFDSFESVLNNVLQILQKHNTDKDLL